MINLRSIYRAAEEHTGWYIGGAFFLLAILILLQTFFSPIFVLSGFVVVGVVIISVLRPLWVLFALAVYLPFETLVLKYTPNEAYVLVRYGSELLIYLLSAVVLFRLAARISKWRQTPIDLPVLLFGLTLVASVVINLVSPTVALLGVRQIVRFMLVFFLATTLKPSKRFIQQLTLWLSVIVLVQCGIGFLQSIVGERVDLFLLPSEARALGDITLTSGVAQTWDPGSRIFATLGRYDRLGNFLYVFLLLAVGFMYEARRVGKKIKESTQVFSLSALVPWVLLLGVPALILTYSRASWFAFLLGFLFIALWIKRDRRVFAALVVCVTLAVGYLGMTGLSVRYITDVPGQTLAERFYETFSAARWRGEYYGLGRVYWAIQTPLVVVSHAPLFGVGPGQYGGGAAAALHNTRVYDALGLPFGVFGTEGYIDNNWFALWGEIGTIGVGMMVWIMSVLFRKARDVYEAASDPFVRGLAIGFAALVIGVCFNAFTSTLLEIRTLAFYFWLYAGFVVVLGAGGGRVRG